MGAPHRRRTGGRRGTRAAIAALLDSLSFAAVDEGGLGEEEPEGRSAWGVTCLIAVAVVVGLIICAGLGTLLVGGFFGVRVSTSSGSRPAPVKLYLNEYPLPHAQSQPHGITAGPDGAMWFTEFDGQRIGRIAPDGTIAEFSLPPDSGKPIEITAGPDGNLWFTEDKSRIGRITSQGTITEFPLPSPYAALDGIAAGPDGNLWFTEEGGANAIARITPGGTVTEYTLPHANSRPVAIAAGPDGNLWFTELGGNRIGRITPQGAIAEFTIPTAASDPESITAGPNAAVWFTENAANKYARITPDGHITEYMVGPTGGPLQKDHDLTGIAADRTGKLWVGTKDNTLIQLASGGSIVSVVGVSTPNALPFSLAVGADGSLWFTELYGNNIGRVQFTGA